MKQHLFFLRIGIMLLSSKQKKRNYCFKLCYLVFTPMETIEVDEGVVIYPNMKRLLIQFSEYL
jgi:hypothetical protein